MDGLCSGVISDLLIGVQIDGLEVFDSGAAHGLFRCARERHRQAKEAADRSGLDSFEMCIASADCISGHATLPIGRSRKRNQLPLFGQEVFDFDRISNGPDLRIAGAHLAIYADASPLTNLQAGITRELSLRAHTDSKNHQVRVKCCSPLCVDNQSSVTALLESFHAVAQPEGHSARLYLLTRIDRK